MAEQTYRAADGYVWKNPIETPHPEGGTNISIGFRVCKMDEVVGDEAAETVAELMNQGERVPALEEALREAIAMLEVDDEASEPGTDLYTWLRTTAEFALAAEPVTTGTVGR